MQNNNENEGTISNHRKVKASMTLNRRYIKRPEMGADQAVSVKHTPEIKHFRDQKVDNSMASTTTREQSPTPVASQEIQVKTAVRPKYSGTRTIRNNSLISGVTARELKERAIKKALSDAKSEGAHTEAAESIAMKNTNNRMHFGIGRVLIALGCAAAAVFAIVYFVNLNAPDISLKVAAMQTGIDPSYPSYVPRGFHVSSITSEDNRVSIEFRDNTSDNSFSLIEEKSSWDSNALESNYIKKTFGDDYSAIREQGLTIFVSNNDAAWVNGGKLYKITMNPGVLTNKQIRAIATSL